MFECRPNCGKPEFFGICGNAFGAGCCQRVSQHISRKVDEAEKEGGVLASDAPASEAGTVTLTALQTRSKEHDLIIERGCATEELYMGILDELLGGGQRQRDYRDFIDRYEKGAPSEGYSDQEVLERYRDVAHAVSPDQYTQAAVDALDKLSPDDRAEFLKMLQERAAARGVDLPRQVAPDPKDLGKVLSDLHEKPGQLRNILVGGDTPAQEQAPRSNPIIDLLSSPQAKAVLAGIAAMVVKRFMQGSRTT